MAGLTEFEKFKAHLKTVNQHRKVVRKWCFKMGIPLQGLTHDLSKYSPRELQIYKWYTGKKSPHDTARGDIGFSPSWYCHRNKNKHHWEVWVDSFESRTAVKIPFKYVIEIFCDFVGAGKVYYGDKWTEKDPLKYHLKTKNSRIYHPDTLFLLELLFTKLYELGEKMFIEWWKDDRDAVKGCYELNYLERRFNYKKYAMEDLK